MNPDQVVQELGLIGAALIRKDGTVVRNLLPDGIDKETFSVMCATIYGAAVTVYGEMKYKEPTQIFMEGQEGHVVLLPFDSRHFWSLIIPATKDVKKVTEEFLEKTKE